MVDTRFPVEWLLDRRIQQLSDADHRAFVNAFMWSVANRTDGRVACADLALIPGMSDSAAALVAAGLWAVVDETGWLITDFESTQTSRAEHEMLERARRKEREKKARQRAKVAQQEPGQNPVQGDSPEGRPRGHVPGTTQEGRQAGRQASLNPSTYQQKERKKTQGGEQSSLEKKALVSAATRSSPSGVRGWVPNTADVT
jgi:hypothetical protein